MDAVIVLFYASLVVMPYALYGIFWRLVLSPIAKFPGPKLAAATFWYEFYYDVIKGGAHVFEIELMHERYGESRDDLFTRALY